MCGRYTLYSAKDLAPRFNLAAKPKFVSQDNYNVAPRQNLPIIYLQNGQRQAELMSWGFIPFWAKDLSKERRPINTISETAWEKPMWRQAIKSHRCLVPARGFYEWKPLADGTKQPYYIHPKGTELFSFAGIYSAWEDVEKHPMHTFSILTTEPNKEMEPIHNRMPVILRPDQEDVWLDPANSQPALLAELLRPFEDGKLEIHKVSKDVNSPRNNDKHLVETVA